MSWTAPKTWNPGDVQSASDLNTYLRDNLLWLLGGFATAYINYCPAADYTTTAATFGDVDGVNLSLSLMVHGGRAMVWATFVLEADNTASSSAEADLIADNTTRAGGADGLVRAQQNNGGTVTILGYWSGLADGLHNFKLQFRNVTAGATASVRKVNPGATRGGPITMFGLAW